MKPSSTVTQALNVREFWFEVPSRHRKISRLTAPADSFVVKVYGVHGWEMPVEKFEYFVLVRISSMSRLLLIMSSSLPNAHTMADQLFDVHNLHVVQRLHKTVTPLFLSPDCTVPKVPSPGLDYHRQRLMLHSRHHRPFAFHVQPDADVVECIARRIQMP